MITITGELQGYPLQSNLKHDENSGRITGDRAVNSEYLQDFWKTFFTTGVVQIPTTALQVVALGAMAVQINAGICLIDGTLGRAKYDIFINLGNSSTTHDLQYRICLRRDLSLAVRQIVAAVREGSPQPIREGDLFEIVLADVTVPRLSTVITQSNITDRRNDAALCGHIHAPINNPDLTAFVRQVDTFMDEQMRAWQAMKENHKTEWHDRWTGWMGETEAVLASERSRIVKIAREMTNLILAKETNTFHLINHNFDDWSVQRGCNARVEFLPDGNIRETITVISPEMPLAERLTTFDGNKIATTVTFWPWVRRLCMGCDRDNKCEDCECEDCECEEDCGGRESCCIKVDNSGIWKCRNITISTDFSITKYTTFEADGSITEVIQ